MTTDDLISKTKVAELLTQTLEICPRHATERVMKRSDFPKPVLQVGRRAVYLRQSVLKWLGLK